MNFQRPIILAILQAAFHFLVASIARAEDGYRLWLRYEPIPAVTETRSQITAIIAPGNSPTLRAIRQEFTLGCTGLLGAPVPLIEQVDREGVVIVGTRESSPIVASLALDDSFRTLGTEGFLLRSISINGHACTVIAAPSELGALYGTFHFLRQVQMRQPLGALDVREKPRFQRRLLNHWDNLDGSIERGYAGPSLWPWNDLPETSDLRLIDYARANASIGINGTVLNNVNAHARSLTPEYLRKTAAIADVFRPYGLRVFLSARFSAPMELGKLKTADPLDPKVRAWWKAKADEIYALIPDFGGFLVKANSEGQPGPLTYGRSHADGANMLAEALASHGGIVMWRAFVYDPQPGSDRIAQACDALKPLDGKFAPNVLLQVKNGPLDFQPREPFHPLFGAMPNTQLMPELQITQEYLGHSNHLVFLAPMWREFLDADTFARGAGSTVTKIADGELHGQKLTAIAGVANTGKDRNWTGHHLAQANWYAFGRLAWRPDLSAEQIADEWARLTFTADLPVVKTITRLLLESHEAAVDYTMPLGLTHLIWKDHHYGPQPWWDREPRPDWNPTYFHRADAGGLGFDRTRTGSNAVSQYHPGARERFADLAQCPDESLLWFHHVPWNHRMRSGRTLWDELCWRYQRGVGWVRNARKDWATLAGKIDEERHAAIAAKLAIQEHDAEWWRDACLLYFQTHSQRPIPNDVEKPKHSLQDYQAKSLLSEAVKSGH
jgi:alpha-glucuronidase